MKYEEEKIARDLYDALTQELATATSHAIVSIEGRGVHWHCTAEQEERFCSIACFYADGTEYLIRFERNAQTLAHGRTSQKKEALSAISGWLQGQELQALHDRFEFIDKQKRALAAIRALAIECCPELAQCTTGDLRHISDDLYELWFHAKDRSCCISCYGKDDLPIFVFHWDECPLFRIQTGKFRELASILKQWLCNYAMPSDLQKEFSWIDMGKLAQYYEEGRGTEGEFIVSWDSIEQFYGKMY